MSSKSHMVSFRLSNTAYAKIEVALECPANGNSSVGAYCKQVIERYAFRHDKRKYKIMSKAIDVSDLINLTQTAKYLDVSYMTIYRWRKNGKIKVVYIGGFPYVPLGELVKIKEGINNGKTTEKNS